MATPYPTSGADSLAGGQALKDDSRRLMQGLRRALTEACAAAGVDPARPRQAARLLGVDKTLMWRVSRIVSEPDVFQAVSHVPRRAGVRILCEALARAAVPGATVERVHALLAAFDALAARHGGDRATFELLAAGFSPAESTPQSLEQGRRLAFRGNSAVWGVQARLQLATCILFPAGAGRSRIDVVRLSGFVGLVRLRAEVSWPLSQATFFDEPATGARRPAAEALEAGTGDGRGALLAAFSSASLPALESEAAARGESCILPAGVPGRMGELTAVFGWRYRGLRWTQAGAGGRLMANLNTPAEQLQFDLLVHRDLAGETGPGMELRGALDGRSGAPAPPFGEAIVDLGQGLAGSATPHMPHYPALLGWVFSRLRADPADFRAFRFAMAYPPIPAKALMHLGPRAATNGHRAARPGGGG